MLLSAEHITKYQNENSILEDVSFAIEERMKLGLIGVNGVGKTTLLRILAGEEHLDSGRIIQQNGLRVHYLPQNPRFQEGKTIYQCVLDAVNEKQREARTFEIQTILSKLGMRDYEQTVEVLSGGQRKRVALACALVSECDLLILDEPTNHLDNDMVEWLEHYLMKYPKALLMVTHDRYFLERITDHLMELDRGNLYLYDGNYETYLEMKEQRSQMEAVQLKKRQKLLKKELAWMRAGVQARGTKSQSRIDRFYELRTQCRAKQDETMQSIDSITSRLGRKIMEITDLRMGYDDKILFHDVNFRVKKRDRIGIIGPNGCGKTTLLNVLSHNLEPLSGEVVIGETVKLGFFHQGDDQMDLSMRVIDYIRDQGDQIQTTDGTRTAAQLLEQFLFPKQLQYTQIKRLSGGERRRLYLLKVLIASPNVLFLDEPTNDLDIQTLTILEDYLDTFPGVIITVSHDRYFLDRICDSLFVFQADGTLREYAGGYSDYIARQAAEPDLQTVNKSRGKSRAERSSIPSFTSSERREFESIDEVIAGLEAAIADIDLQMESRQDQFDEIAVLADQREKLTRDLDLKTERWMELQEKYDAIQAARKGR